ncbi:hypothetical protein O6H91_02G149900 [Diphasiastrum complanatum]|nr:hypothetical protein O6H91_02G149900 [Diphasiastrum complanatum]
MMSSAQLRLMSDLKAIQQEPPEGCSASPHSEENLFVWGATVFGPDETAWEGAILPLRLTFGEHYPAKPPRVRFTSEVFHPNGIIHTHLSIIVMSLYVSLTLKLIQNYYVAVYNDGTLCMDIIQDAWSPCHNVCTILTSIQSLLTDPNPSSPANPEAAHLYQTDLQAYNRRVRQCVRKSLECSM